MYIRDALLESQKFFVEHRGRLGLSYGILIGAFVMHIHEKSMRKGTVELVVSEVDAEMMLKPDTTAVYQTKFGPVFATMDPEAAPMIGDHEQPLYLTPKPETRRNDDQSGSEDG
ncbi:membrane protein [Gordonia phage Pherobrine]|nr:membrane protein [Gordonia phage Pherobrine]